MTTVDRELVKIARDVAMQAADADPDVSVTEGSRKCPVCQHAMASVRAGHVTLDVCEPHGTWFDRDELGRLARNLEHERVSHLPAPPPDEPVTSKNAAMLLALIGQDP
jgi:Zn-finger nucleic acid-binding protein